MDEALYLARAVARACSHSSVGHVLVVTILERSGRLWEAQQEAEEADARMPDDEDLSIEQGRTQCTAHTAHLPSVHC